MKKPIESHRNAKVLHKSRKKCSSLFKEPRVCLKEAMDAHSEGEIRHHRGTGAVGKPAQRVDGPIRAKVGLDALSLIALLAAHGNWIRGADYHHRVTHHFHGDWAHEAVWNFIEKVGGTVVVLRTQHRAVLIADTVAVFNGAKELLNNGCSCTLVAVLLLARVHMRPHLTQHFFPSVTVEVSPGLKVKLENLLVQPHGGITLVDHVQTTLERLHRLCVLVSVRVASAKHIISLHARLRELDCTLRISFRTVKILELQVGQGSICEENTLIRSVLNRLRVFRDRVLELTS